MEFKELVENGPRTLTSILRGPNEYLYPVSSRSVKRDLHLSLLDQSGGSPPLLLDLELPPRPQTVRLPLPSRKIRDPCHTRFRPCPPGVPSPYRSPVPTNLFVTSTDPSPSTPGPALPELTTHFLNSETGPPCPLDSHQTFVPSLHQSKRGVFETGPPSPELHRYRLIHRISSPEVGNPVFPGKVLPVKKVPAPAPPTKPLL